MKDKCASDDREWERGWSGHERAQLLRLSRLSFREKIRWLEEAQRFIEELQRRKNSPGHEKGRLRQTTAP